MSIPIEEFEKRLHSISEHNGVPYGRARMLFENEDKHSQACLQYKDYLALSGAFKCLFLETVGLINNECLPKVTTPFSEFYASFVPRLAHSFKSLCGSEMLAIKGYPYHAYTLLRNTFDNLVLTSAALQGITDFYRIEGLEKGKKFDLKSLNKLRKKTEFEVRQKMTGARSGLNQTTLDELEKWDEAFDYEVHGARFSLSDSLLWMKGQEPLPVLPTFQERAFAMFMTRYCEVAWLVHRLLPLIQHSGAPLGYSWKEKWRIIDESFETMVNSLTNKFGKKIGTAFDDFVKQKFAFNEKSVFPL
jgi:hypothetical protein